jgi:hypothetical protein
LFFKLKPTLLYKVSCVFQALKLVNKSLIESLRGLS